MVEAVLKTYIEQGYSTQDIALSENVGKTTVRYWLKKFGLKTKNYKNQIELKRPKKCSVCGETDPSKFYGNKRTICGKCHCSYTTKKGKENKEKAVEYLGGKCIKCGYNKCIEALDFHHTDKSKKDISFKSKRGWSWTRLKKELDKCILVCSNCHREIHNGD